MQAFICNYRDHWFTIRRLGQQWFNLNSLLTGPELISDTYLAMFLAQLQQEGKCYQELSCFWTWINMF
jgi:ataxin-3